MRPNLSLCSQASHFYDSFLTWTFLSTMDLCVTFLNWRTRVKFKTVLLQHISVKLLWNKLYMVLRAAHRELSKMVLSLCAMVSTVQWENSLRMVFWIRSSVSRSTAAVASSRISIRDFLSKARARHSSCLWPTLWEIQNQPNIRC